MKKILGVIVIGIFIWACSSSGGSDEEPQPNAFDRAVMLENWADNIIIPSYMSFSQSLDNLEAAFNTFNADRTEENLVAFRDVWRDTYLSWQRVSLFEIGPAESIGYRLNMNIYPTDVTQINTNVISGNADLSLASNRDAKGFPALDYLINGLADTDTEIVTRYNLPTEGDNLSNYVESLIADMQSLTTQVLQAWQNGFRDQFVSNDGSSATASVDLYVNDYIFYYERFLRAGKIGIPAGVFSNTPLPQNIEALFDGTISNDLFLEALDAVQDFFNGVAFNSTTNGISLDDYLNTLERNDLTDLINRQYNIARNAFVTLDALQVELESNPPLNLLSVYDQVQAIVPLIKVDMLSVLNINIDFRDADGD